jgi:hypothetical protein
MTALECKKTQQDLQRGLKHLINTTEVKKHPWAKDNQYEVDKRFWNPTPGQVNLDVM